MSRALRGVLAAIAVAALIVGCSSTDDTPSGSPSPTATITSSQPSPTPSGTASPSPAVTASETCEAAGETGPTTSGADWAAHLSASLYGVTMRVGVHDCYERWVLEFAGDGDAPGWSVTPHDGGTFALDPSDNPVDPPLAGDASLEVLVGAWYDGTPIDQPAYEGPLVLAPGDTSVIREVRILGAFEGVTQVGIGLRAERPYSVTWLDAPARLVIDVYTG